MEKLSRRITNNKGYSIFILVVVSVVMYHKIFSGFFQQDEWLGVARSIVDSDKSFFDLIIISFSPSSGHWVPFSKLALQLLFKLFGLNYLMYAILSVSLHVFTVVLVFFFGLEVFKDNKKAFLVGLIFSLMAAGYQATSWVMADTSVHFSVIFALLSAILTVKFARFKKRGLFMSAIFFLVISLLFKEVTLGMVIILPIIIVTYSKKVVNGNKKYIFAYLSSGIVYVLLRVSMMFGVAQSNASAISVGTSNFFAVVYANITKSVTQSFFPSGFLRALSEVITTFLPGSITGPKGITQYELFMLDKVFEPISVLVFVFVTWLVISYAKRNLKIMWMYLWIVVNILVFVLSPEKTGRIYILDSRNLYFVSIGASFLLVVFYYFMLNKSKEFAHIILFAFMTMNFVWLQKEIVIVSERGAQRRQILNSIKNNYPTLPKKVIFYIDSDTSYYGLPIEKANLPFQSGPGQSLLVWYWGTEGFPREFYANRYLWEISEQGYREYGDRGFGYFRNYDDFLNTMDEYGLQSDSVVAFSWNGDIKILRDITDEIRGEIENGE